MTEQIEPCTKTIRFADRLLVCQATGPHTQHVFQFSDKDCDLLTHAVYSPKYYGRVMATAQEALRSLVDVAEFAQQCPPLMARAAAEDMTP